MVNCPQRHLQSVCCEVYGGTRESSTEPDIEGMGFACMFGVGRQFKTLGGHRKIRIMKKSYGLPSSSMYVPYTQMQAEGLFDNRSGWGYWRLTKKGISLAQEISRIKAVSSRTRKPQQGKEAAPKDNRAISEHDKKLAVEEKAIKYILRLEDGWQRTKRNHPGFDLYQGQLEKPRKVCEVKASSRGSSAPLTEKQREVARMYGKKYWLYRVSYVGAPTKMRVERIQNPA